MTTLPQGRLERVDLRECWASEAGDFTPWLAQEENLMLLGETLGIDLELVGTESGVGPFSADIVATDLSTGAAVLIENQLERTDHTHLGQLLTYAAGKKAVHVVWIAAQFTDEHRAALDWLNEVTDDRASFFGLAVEVWRIGDSPVAPKFNIVSQPNAWTRTTRQASGEGLSETKQLQLEYWTQFKEYAAGRAQHVKLPSPAAQSWLQIAIGRTHFGLRARLSTWPESNRTVGALLVLMGPDADPHYRLLLSLREEIEADLGFKPTWRDDPMFERLVSVEKAIADPTDRAQWPEQHEWMLSHLESLHRVFAPLVKGLDASEYVPSEDEQPDA